MTAAKMLYDAASLIASELQRETPALEAELVKMEARKSQIIAEIQAAKFASQRLASFRLTVNGDFLCAQCWMFDGVETLLKPIGSDDETDRYRCRKCYFELPIPI
jgi:hypothetical protein